MPDHERFPREPAEAYFNDTMKLESTRMTRLAILSAVGPSR